MQQQQLHDCGLPKSVLVYFNMPDLNCSNSAAAVQAGTSERVSVQRDKDGNVSLASVSFLLFFSSSAQR